jgi:autonomous glycyl radical cofactor GrcA
MIEIVCATGGTCGDIITAIMDTTDIEFRDAAVKIAPERSRLKKPHTFADDSAKQDYIDLMSSMYNSIPSHDVDFHTRYQQPFISVTVEQFDRALWAAERFKRLHRPHVWEEMQQVCGATTVDEYAQVLIDYSKMIRNHTDRLISLERILEGHAVEDLKQLTDLELNNEFYQQWLKLQHDAC